MEKIDLNAPAFGEKAVKLDEVTSAIPAEASQAEEGTSQEEQRVPYSRFETVRERAEQAERDAQEARERVMELESRPTRTYDQSPYEDAIKSRIIKLYGDNDTSKEIIEIELNRQREIEEQAEQAALRAVRAERENEVSAIRQNEGIIDSRLESLSDYLGRDLTAKEEDALLDVVDEFTPKNSDGTYAGETISFDKAWEILETRGQVKATQTSRSREVPTFLSGNRTEGEPAVNTQGEWKRGWNNYQDRFNN
jgi:hypothetical protein